MRHGRKPFGKTLFAALLGVTVFVAPAFSEGTYTEIEVQTNRFGATAGSSSPAVVIVSVEDFENPALQGAAIEDVTPLAVINDNPSTDTADAPGFHVKNPAGGAPPGAALLVASGAVTNLGDGLYGFTVVPGGGGVWLSGDYVIQVRLVLCSSASHGASDLCGIHQATITIP